MVFGFFGALAKGHGKKAIQQVTDAVVALDPKTASEAQLVAMEEDLRATASKLAQFRSMAAKEQKDVVEVKERRARMLTAGEKLYGQYNAETDPTKRASLEQSLVGLRQTIMDLDNEVVREEQEANDAIALVQQAEEAVNRKGAAINEAKTLLKRAINELDRAKLQEQSAKERAEYQREIAGLAGSNPGGLNGALSSLTKQAEQARISAEAHNIVTDQITVIEPGTTEDPNVLAALAALEGPKADNNELAALFGPKSSPLQITQQ